jgi:hypothetical protein
VRVRRDRLAEALLSLVGPADRAASVIGDLMEEAGERGRIWFWRSVTRIWLALLGRDLIVAPFAMAVSCGAAWFLYMLVSLVMAFVGYVAVTLVWGIAYVFRHHTGLELLANGLRIRLDWPPIPDWMTYAIQAAVLLALAPFQIGRGSSLFWRGHEMSLAVLMLIIWTAMAWLVPLVGVGIRAYPSMVPVMVGFMLLGALFERFRASPSA